MPARIFGIDLGRSSILASDSNPLSVKPPGSGALDDLSRPSTSMDHIKRPAGLILGKRHGSADKQKDRSLSSNTTRSPRDAPRSPLPPKPVTLALLMESPPALFIDPPSQSSGALISGRLQVTPALADVAMTSIIMYLEATTTIKRPVTDRCRECANTVNDLFEWTFLSKPKTFKLADGMQELPFSHLIPGHLPSTTHGTLGSIDYSLHVRAFTTSGQQAEFRRDLIISRALRPGNDRNSVRIFPPTNLSLNVTLPSQIHPIGDFPISCRMTGIATKSGDTQTRWRLRKLTWRIEEYEEMVSPACAKHAGKVGGEGKGIKHEHKRDIGWQELKQGWKTDFDDGLIEGEFTAAVDSTTKPQHDVEAANGLKVSHALILELVIAEEWAPIKRPHQATPTGAARILRTQFALNVTSRAGMGISWDDEQPPRYEDVPDSPPHYINQHTRMELYEGDDLQGDIENLTLN